MSPSEIIVYANSHTDPMLIYMASVASAEAVNTGVEQLTALLLPGTGADFIGKEAERFRSGEVDVLIATRKHLIGLHLWRDNPSPVTILWGFAPTTQEAEHARSRIIRS